MGRALPPTRTGASDELGVVPRAQATFVTMYGLYDDSSYSGPRASGKPRLAPVGEVYVAMLSSSLANSPSPTGTDGASPVETLPPLGPGIVLLPPTSTVSGLSTSAETQTVDDSIPPAPTGLMAPGPSSRAVLLGSVVGGILLFTLCLFFLLNPRVSGKAGDFLRFTKRVAKRRRNDSSTKEIPPGSKEAAWVSATGATFNPDERAGSETPSSSPEKVKEKLADPSGTPPTPALSKFSVYSAASAYLDTPSPTRPDSMTASDNTSTNGTAIPNYDANAPCGDGSPSSTPPRPPRPPTADSPALSDSVYLACSDQPYVIVVPQRLSKMPVTSEVPTTNSRKLLTPSEFITLHGAGTAAADTRLGGGAAALDTKPEKDRCVSFQPNPKRESVHARTKSAPILGFILRHADTASSMFSFNDRRSFDTVSGGYNTGSDSEMDHSEITKKLLKHRRSRSASGWAYPERDQQKSKKFFSIETPSLLR